MSTSVGRVQLDLGFNKRGFQNEVNKMGQENKSMFSKMGMAFSMAIGNIVAQAAMKAVSAIGRFTKESVKLGSNLTEVQNVVDTAFPNMSAQVEKFATGAIGTVGISETMAKQYTGIFGIMSKSMGATEKQAWDLSTEVTNMVGDVASFYNLDHEQAYTKLKAIWSGETEGLKDLGVVMTEQNLQQFAQQKGYKQSYKDMDQLARVTLRQAFVMDALKAANGDFIKTQDTWANKTRVLSLRMDAFKATIGQGLINALTPLLHYFDILLQKMGAFAASFAKLTESLFGKTKQGTKSMGAGVTEAMSAVSTGAETAADGVVASAKKMKGALAPIDQLNIIGAGDSGGGGGSGGASAAPETLDTEQGSAKGKDATPTKIDELKAKLEAFEAYVATRFGPTASVAFARVAGGVSTLAVSFGKAFEDVKAWGEPLADWFKGGFSDNINSAMESVGIFTSVRLKNVSMMFDGLWQSVEPILDNFIRKGLPRISDFVGQVFSLFNTLVTTVDPLFDKLWTQGIEPVLKLISSIAVSVFDSIWKAWDNFGAPIFNALKATVKSVTDVLMTLWVTTLEPIWNKLVASLQKIWFESLKPLFDEFLNFVALVSLRVMELWNKYLAPIVKWLLEKFGPPITRIIKEIIDAVTKVVQGIIDYLKGLIRFLRGVFTGDWEVMWQGIKQMFEGIWNAIEGLVELAFASIIAFAKTCWEGIKSAFSAVVGWFSDIFSGAWNAVKRAFSFVGEFFAGVWQTIKDIFNGIGQKIGDTIGAAFKSVVNSILDFAETRINGFISAINKAIDLINKIPGVSLGYLKPLDIPRLAKGGIIKQPTLSMVGEAGTEAVVPLENTSFSKSLGKAVASEVRKALAEMLPAFAQRSADEGRDLIVILTLEGIEVGRAVVKSINKFHKSVGKVVLEV
jgi:phage-related protein